ncbi:VanZ family protein [Ahniella affigens]|uniref:VanZ family protein n=1 Tax=Ahniella affigens TaxID=2021234 RepID=A0A2P1PME5_9GAMM|nr:VanZ family protein [Ahniella affigens]AVP96014.1 VanZ family protein [Ahniella affigens]
MSNSRSFWLGRMHPFRHPRLWIAVAWFGIVLCIVLSLVPSPKIGVSVPGNDKLHHALAYFALMIWHGWLLAQQRALKRAALFLLILGVVLEVLQSFLPWRQGNDPMDLLANVSGIALAWLLLLTPVHDLLRAWDRKF